MNNKKVIAIITSVSSIIGGFFIKRKICEKLVAADKKQPTRVKFKNPIKLVNYGLARKVAISKKAGSYPIEEKTLPEEANKIVILIKGTLIGAPKYCWDDQQVIFS